MSERIGRPGIARPGRMSPTSFGIDLDRVGSAESLPARLVRRFQGRYPVDPFGADPMLQDAVIPTTERFFSIEVEGFDAVPEVGPAVLVTSRRPGPGDPLVVRAAVRDVRRRRARIVGYADLPAIGGLARRLGAVRARGEDLAAVLRLGHIAVVPLSADVRAGRAGHAAAPVLWGAVGFPVFPVAVWGGLTGFAGIPFGHHRVVVGPRLDLDGIPGDPLSAAELAEAARIGVEDLFGARRGGLPTPETAYRVR